MTNQKARRRDSEREREGRADPKARIAAAALENAKLRASRNPEALRSHYELFVLGLRKPDFLSGIAPC
jgi:hypothetical protein